MDGHTDGRTDGHNVPTEGRTFLPQMLLGRLGGVDLKMTRYHCCKKLFVTFEEQLQQLVLTAVYNIIFYW